MDKKKIIKEIQFQQSPDRANFDELNESNGHLSEINETLKKPLKVEMPEKISATADFVTGFLNSIKGEKGDKGDKGDTGDTGETGADGYTPEKGTDYFTEVEIDEIVMKASQLATPVKGIDYNDGEPGKDGIDGVDGQPGKDGVNGVDGKDVEIKKIVKEVIAQIKSLKGNDRIDVSSVRNAEIAGKKRKLDMSDLRWHGGGISAVLAEIPTGDVNGVNKTYTTTKTPFAVFVNGQFMTPEGIDVTITTTTFVLVTAPLINSVIYVLYV